ncbi:Pyridoxine/pyridoxamine 5'-phosphate oxidase [Pandoraea sputorum]|uniref:Pyridoxine/pyridoxamine 5'-phosphate oxidase n=2 Tax=Pandoraea sputorum TaxID=93222 RepID=A0A5E5ARY7_9BURK|nr:Pyridoxine/pyridoxamine 5'-phosphate oxidase [Pandoraea sputorum]
MENGGIIMASRHVQDAIGGRMYEGWHWCRLRMHVNDLSAAQSNRCPQKAASTLQEKYKLKAHSSDALLSTIWGLLDAATRERSAFNFMQLATIGTDGAPKGRVVVLRDAHPKNAELFFTADLRSSKISEIRGDSRVALSAFDVAKGVQLRAEGRAEVVSDPALRLSAWRKLKPHSHVLFRSNVSPGTPLTDPTDVQWSTLPQTPTLEIAAQFALLRVSIEKIDWLDVSSEPHVRCLFNKSAGHWAGTWVAP